MKGGYIMIDCGGMNLLSETSQTISGLYTKVAKAVTRNKPIYAYNCVYGAGVPITPIQVFAIKESGNYICTASILQITVESNDAVTITSLISA